MSAIDLDIERSFAVGGMTARLLTYTSMSEDVKKRFHEQYLFTHVLTPRREFGLIEDPRVGRSDAAAKIGAFQFLPKCVSVSLRVHLKLRVAQCVFDAEFFENITGVTDPWREDKLGSYMNVRGRRIQYVMQSIEQELADPTYSSLILIEALGKVLSVELGRYFRRERPRGNDLGRLSRGSIKRIEEYVHSNCGNGSIPSTAELANLCGISVGHLIRSFKNSTGVTPHAFVENVRLAKASDLLRDTALPLKSIAAAVGFGSQSRFSESFKRATGEQPTQFRKRIRGTY